MRFEYGLGRHEAFCRSRATQTVRDPQSQTEFTFLADELVNVINSHKVWSIFNSIRTRTHRRQLRHQFNGRDVHRLFTEANLRPIRCWTDVDTGNSLWLLERPPFNFRLLQSPTSVLSNTPFGIPCLRDFEEMWAAWDFIAQKMIPESMMFEKPIDLRHIYLFYTGHIPTFLDIHLSRLLGEPHTEPEYFKVRSFLT